MKSAHKILWFALATLIPMLSAAASEKNTGAVSSLEPQLGDGNIHFNGTSSNFKSYGFNLIIRYKFLGAELGGIEGLKEKNSTGLNTRTEEGITRIRFGLRASFGLLSFLETFVNGGIEGQRYDKSTFTTATTAPFAETETALPSPMYAYPYVGTGLSLMFNDHVALNVSGSATLKSGGGKANDYLATVGIQLTEPISKLGR